MCFKITFVFVKDEETLLVFHVFPQSWSISTRGAHWEFRLFCEFVNYLIRFFFIHAGLKS